jgi:hypothetical protein
MCMADCASWQLLQARPSAITSQLSCHVFCQLYASTSNTADLVVHDAPSPPTQHAIPSTFCMLTFRYVTSPAWGPTFPSAHPPDVLPAVKLCACPQEALHHLTPLLGHHLRVGAAHVKRVHKRQEYGICQHLGPAVVLQHISDSAAMQRQLVSFAVASEAGLAGLASDKTERHAETQSRTAKVQP